MEMKWRMVWEDLTYFALDGEDQVTAEEKDLFERDILYLKMILSFTISYIF